MTIRAWWKIRNRRENVHMDYRPKVKKTKENGEGVNDARKWISWRPSWLTNDDRRRRRRRFLGARRRTSGHPLREEGQKRRGRLSGTLPAENTAAQTETPSSSRRLFMYETVAYVHSGKFLPPRCIRLLRVVPFVSTSEFVRYSYVATVNDERRLSLCLLTLAHRGNFAKKSESHGRAFHHNATKP